MTSNGFQHKGARKRKTNDDYDVVHDSHSSHRSGRQLGLTKREREMKRVEIHKVLRDNFINLDKLRNLACSNGGLISNDIRRRAWPLLLHVNANNMPNKYSPDELEQHGYYEQVVMDVKRSLKRFPPGMKDMERLSLQDQMISIIMRILTNHSDLHYYQGFHDICVTFLLVVGESNAVCLCDKLTQSHLREFMDKTMEKTCSLLNYLYPIIGHASHRLELFMERAEVGTIFALPWLLTWYGHVLTDMKHIVRLYDFFIASHPLMPIYLGAAIVLHREEEILSCECEMAMIHGLLSKIPPHLPFELLIEESITLFQNYPPDALRTEAGKIAKHNFAFQTYKQLSQLKNLPTGVSTSERRKASVKHIADLIPEMGAKRAWLRHAVWLVTGSLAALTWYIVREWHK